MDEGLPMERNVGDIGELANDLWNPGTEEDSSKGRSYLEITFPQVTVVTAIRITAAIQGVLNGPLTIRLELKRSSDSQYEILPSATGQGDDWSFFDDKKVKLQQDPKIEVTKLRLTLVFNPDYQDDLQFIVDVYGCHARGNYFQIYSEIRNW